MADIAIFRINYKSDFILTLNSDAGWMTPFCIKFWTGAPSQAYFSGFDGTTYTHCAPVDGEPTKLRVQFDDHHLPIGDLKFQIGYHFTVADFPTAVEDEVINQAAVIIDQDGTPMQVMLDLNGETAPEIQFSLPAYANEAQRIANEQQRIAAETQRIANEESRIVAETIRQQNETQRINNEAQRIRNEEARIAEFAQMKAEAIEATDAANSAAALANEKAALAADKAALAAYAAQLANDKAALSQAAAQLANDKAQLAADKAALAQAASQLCDEKATLAQQKATYAQQQGDYSKAQGDYAKEQGDYSKAQGDYSKEQGDYSKEQGDYAKDKGDICADDHQTAVADHQTATADHQTAAADHQTATTDHNQAGNDHTRAESDHTRAESDHAAVELYVDSLGAFDISAYHATGGVLAKYADLTAALGTNGANIPEAIRKGGMSVKFVQSSDNKYVQYRLMAQNFTTDVTQWQGVDDEPTAGSDNLVKSGGVAVFSGGNTIYKSSVENYIHNSKKTEQTNITGVTSTFIRVNSYGLYEITSEESIDFINGSTQQDIAPSFIAKVYVPCVFNGKTYLYVSPKDITDGVTYLIKPNFARDNVTSVYVYNLLLNESIKGVVSPDTVPSGYVKGSQYIPICGGTYMNFGNTTVYQDELCYLEFNGSSWEKKIYGHLNVFNIPFKTSAGYWNTSGTEKTDNDSFNETEKIDVSKGDVIICEGYAGEFVSKIAAFDDTGFLRNLYNDVGTTYNRYQIIDSDVKYVVISLANSNHSNYVTRFAGIIYNDVNLRKTSGQVVILNSAVSSLQSDISAIRNEITVTQDVYDYSENYRIATDGASTYNKNYVTTPFIPVSEGNVILYSGMVTNGYSCVVGYNGQTDSDFVQVLLLGDSNQKTDYRIVIPSGVSYIRAASRNIANPISLKSISEEIGKKVDNHERVIIALQELLPKLENKNIAVIGDSISTSEGLNPYITVLSSDVGNEIQSYITWWDVYKDLEGTKLTNTTIGGVILTSSMIGTLQTFIPVSDDIGKEIGRPLSYYPNQSYYSGKTWPQLLCEKLGANLINASWSGASMCSGQSQQHRDLSYGWSDCTIGRCKKRDSEGNEVKPDVIIIYRGTNDFSHKQGSSYSYLDSNYDLEENGYPNTDVYDTNKYGFFRAYYLTIKKLREAYPNAIIYCCTLNVFKRVTSDRFPTRNGQYTLPQMNDAIRQIANTMGCGLIEFDKDGITFENCYPTYISDSATTPTHPNGTGHIVLSNKAYSDLRYSINAENLN